MERSEELPEMRSPFPNWSAAACVPSGAGGSDLPKKNDLSTVVVHHIHLNKGFQSDLRWWDLFLEGWNGVFMFASLA